MRRRAGAALLAVAALPAAAPASGAVRIGGRYERAVNFVGGLQQAALTADVPVALRWQPFHGVHVSYYVEVGGGAFLNGSPDARPFVEAGPEARLSRSRHGWFVGLGICPTLVGGSEFRDNRQLGGSFFFTSHIDLGWRFAGWTLALRFQHTSNANINHPNPGVNMIGVAFTAPL